MSNLYNVIGTNTPEHLLADPLNGHPIAVPLEPGNGEIKRGMLLYRKASGLWAPAGTSQISTSYALAVMNENIDTGTTIDGDTVAENAAAYQTGRFIDGKVLYDNSGTPTKVTAAHKVVLGLQGIFFDQSMESAPEMDNGTYKITYHANNEADPAEDDVVKYKVAGATHTVLNNSDSSLGFTAPATKSFSKWNTKANGSGTDYAAAATYSTDADLDLYAVWA
ncbi:MAG: hypothetical protein IKN04_11890 [Clostridia bacterium]|nr:hypothetical protein [Clostridia bacterium]